jgi:protocatechuate 3,4-dioxygenase beta subunit
MLTKNVRLSSTHAGLFETLTMLGKKQTLVGGAAINRRQALFALTSLAGVSLASAPMQAMAACALIPTETGGPFPGDGTNGPNALAQSGILRSDIRSNFAGAGTATTAGTSLSVTLQLVSASTGTNGNCPPLAGYALYLWHCDAAGLYSMYSGAALAANYLRGVQVTNSLGQVRFQTIFPAAYSGRWPHMHFEIFSSVEQAVTGRNALRTSQLALPEAICNEVFAQSALYPNSANNMRQTTLANDNVFSDDRAATQLATVEGSIGAGYSATLTIGINAVVAAAITPSVALTDMWFNAQESGWGMSIIQHASTKVFAVIYAYAADSKPVWFVMSDSTWLSPLSFSGKLYQTTGPAFSLSTFNPSDVRVTEVGNLSLAATADGNAANLSYTVNGVTVVKVVTRQGF